MNTETPTSVVLNKAADLIEEKGWTAGPGGWYDSDGLCLEGGIIAALGITTVDWDKDGELLWSCPAYNAVADYLGYDMTRRVDDTGPEQPLWKFNDDQDSAGPVIEVLRAAALIEAAKENLTVAEQVSA